MKKRSTKLINVVDEYVRMYVTKETRSYVYALYIYMHIYIRALCDSNQTNRMCAYEYIYYNGVLEYFSTNRSVLIFRTTITQDMSSSIYYIPVGCPST